MRLNEIYTIEENPISMYLLSIIMEVTLEMEKSKFHYPNEAVRSGSIVYYSRNLCKSSYLDQEVTRSYLDQT